MTAPLCWICEQPAPRGQTCIGGLWVCDACWHAIERPRVDVAGKQLREGLAAMKKDEEKP